MRPRVHDYHLCWIRGPWGTASSHRGWGRLGDAIGPLVWGPVPYCRAWQFVVTFSLIYKTTDNLQLMWLCRRYLPVQLDVLKCLWNNTVEVFCITITSTIVDWQIHGVGEADLCITHSLTKLFSLTFLEISNYIYVMCVNVRYVVICKTRTFNVSVICDIDETKCKI